MDLQYVYLLVSTSSSLLEPVGIFGSQQYLPLIYLFQTFLLNLISPLIVTTQPFSHMFLIYQINYPFEFIHYPII